VILVSPFSENIDKVVRNHEVVILLARWLLFVKQIYKLLLSQLIVPRRFGLGNQFEIELLIQRVIVFVSTEGNSVESDFLCQVL
jgi:hypothetical protein